MNPTHASPEVTRWGVVIGILLGLFDLFYLVHNQGADSVNRGQLDRVWDSARAGDERTLDTARREIALSCQCCLSGKQ